MLPRLFNFPPKQVPTRFKSVSLSLNPRAAELENLSNSTFMAMPGPQSAHIPAQHAVQHRDYIIGTKRASPPLAVAALDWPSWVEELSRATTWSRAAFGRFCELICTRSSDDGDNHPVVWTVAKMDTNRKLKLLKKWFYFSFTTVIQIV